ncbi:MAG: 4Fe-4S ferredoxin [Deltaproteobacteria bacterium]|nr:4Fe-4S ferredoxin [Deltaproteobacteria bacterium]
MIEVIAHYCPQNHPCPVVRLCPVDAIEQEGNSAPKVDQESCIDCCACTNACRAFQGDCC